MQSGKIILRGPSWYLRHKTVRVVNGQKKWETVYTKLIEKDLRHRTQRSVESLAQLALQDINSRNVMQGRGIGQLLSEFIDLIYFPALDLRPSTIVGYKNVYSRYLKSRIAGMVVQEFRPVHGQDLLKLIETEDRVKQTGRKLTHDTLRHIKHFLTAVFTSAVQRGMVDHNPMRDVKVPTGERSGETHAYTLEEVIAILEAIPEPTKTVIATASFTGLRVSELRGLRWTDFHDGQLFVTRTVWRTKTEERTKTTASRAGVPVLPVLAKYLDAHRNGHTEDGLLFAGPKLGLPLNLSNVARRTIVPKLREKKIPWHGWHAFRRGLGTVLRDLGVPIEVISQILRHADIRVTAQHYAKPSTTQATAAMARLNKAFKTASKARK